MNVAAKAAFDQGGVVLCGIESGSGPTIVTRLAADLKGTGVRANSVLPSIIDTDANRQAMPGSDFAKWPKPAEIAEVILYLCSPEAGLIHGASVPVFGTN